MRKVNIDDLDLETEMKSNQPSFEILINYYFVIAFRTTIKEGIA